MSKKVIPTILDEQAPKKRTRRKKKVEVVVAPSLPAEIGGPVPQDYVVPEMTPARKKAIEQVDKLLSKKIDITKFDGITVGGHGVVNVPKSRRVARDFRQEAIDRKAKL